MTAEQFLKHRQTILAEYGNGPAAAIRDLPDVEMTNIAGVPWFFQTSKEYKGLKKQIAANRAKRRQS